MIVAKDRVNIGFYLQVLQLYWKQKGFARPNTTIVIE